MVSEAPSSYASQWMEHNDGVPTPSSIRRFDNSIIALQAKDDMASEKYQLKDLTNCSFNWKLFFFFLFYLSQNDLYIEIHVAHIQ